MNADRRLAEEKAKLSHAKSELRQVQAELHVAERKLHDVLHGVRREARKPR